MYILHYLDDYFLTNSTSSSCSRDLQQVIFFAGELGVPLAPEKMVGPSQVITFLGIEIDSINMTTRLPLEKLVKLRALVLSWQDKKKATKRDLLSLIGFLSFACVRWSGLGECS